MRRPVRILREDVARRIAAGEVIDRPSAIVRELMDNAIDSNAKNICVEIKNGGIDLVKVSDDGQGMTRDDLENCANPHATSKIVDADDLMNITTLGFRGEALASIAAVSDLSISSGTLKMTLKDIKKRSIEEIAEINNGKGTIVKSEHLFNDFPARRNFLKRPASETMMCRETFVEKALPRPDIAFRFTVDDSLRYDFPENDSAISRFKKALELKEDESLFSELKATGKESDGKTDWKFSLVIGNPSIRKNDRRSIFIYVNGRKVQEYSLLQAIEYGCQGFFPNGTHPIAALFAEVNPSLVDFNIHPAKKEVKFRDISSLHHGVSSTVRAHFRKSIMTELLDEDSDNDNKKYAIERNEPIFEKAQEHLSVLSVAEDFSLKEKNDIPQNNETFLYQEKTTTTKNDSAFSIKSEIKPETNLRARFFSFDKTKQVFNPKNEKTPELFNESEIKTNSERKIKYIGRTMDTFILAEKDNTIYFFDQHAVHERYLFDLMMNGDKTKQNLLIPYRIETDDEAEENYVKQILPQLNEAGFEGYFVGEGIFEFKTVPTSWKGSEQSLRDAVLENLEEPDRILYRVFASAACRKAVMQGTIIDDKTAEDLANKAFALPDPHCPHGRPVFFSLTKNQLFQNVRRME